MPGRSYLAIPGPSVMPDEVLRAMHRPAPNIYAGALVDMTASLVPDLKWVARTDGFVAMYIGNGHAAWEAALSNVVAAGETVLVPCTGRFGHGWADMATGLGLRPEILDFGKQSPVDLAAVEEALRKDTAHEIKAVLAVHVDTSTSILNDIKGIRDVLDKTAHPALLMVDCIASLACDAFEMDAWGVDVMVTGCQKGLMVPPGMSFVFFNDKAAAIREDMSRVSRYWDWTPRANPTEFYQYWNGTAPTQHIYGLRVALDMLRAEGMDAVWARHDRYARAIWAACSCWAQGGSLELNVRNPEFRSRAVTSLRLDKGRGAKLRSWVEDNMSLTLGIGLGMAEPDDPMRDDFFRLGHMGHINGHMILGLLGSLQAGMQALDVPLGEGALDAAAAIVSGAD
ncbi:MAG: aminotransferase class V-fold PLP-dependent enzyme [Pseudomonadota bacterium]